MFFKFPHTPHLIWLGMSPCRGDKVLSASEAREFLDGEITVEEKVDGGNIGFSIDESGTLRAQNRGNYLTRGSHLQFQPLWPWLDARRTELSDALGRSLMLFGEWCFARHSVTYSHLPDWFLAFDVYDKSAGRFWSVGKRDPWLEELGLAAVPRLAQGRHTLREAIAMIGTSKLTNQPMEGIYLRRDSEGWMEGRAKIVSAAFAENIDEHWADSPLEKNRLASAGLHPVP